MIASSGLDKLIDDVHLAGLAPEGWSAFAAQLADHFDARVTGMFFYRPGDPLWSFSVELGLAPEWRARFQNDFTVNDNLCEEMFRGSAVGSVAADWMLVPLPKLRKTRLIREWGEPQGLLAAALIKVAQSAETIGLLSMIRGRSAGEWDVPEIDQLRALAPHIVRAAAVSERIGALEGQLRLSEVLLERHLQPLIVADAQARVCFVSGSARTILDSCDGLSSKRGRLEAARAVEANQLRAAIAGAARSKSPRSGVVYISRPSKQKALKLLVSPIATELELGAQLTHRALIFITDMEVHASGLETKLRTSFQLTSTEAQLACILSEGSCSLSAAAERLGVTRNTAKTHLQRVFSKTNTHRQSELVCLALRLSAKVGP